jgi:hypothetical protein
VDGAGIGSTGSASQETANLLMLDFVVAASPDQSTRKLMIGLYRSVLSGDPRSVAENKAIIALERTNPCVSYP